MNYLWEVALKADNCSVLRERIRYVPTANGSPYLEASFVDLNMDTLDGNTVESNPLYRFSFIFSSIFNINVAQARQTREALYDVFMQYMIQLDLRQGLCRNEYFLRFILKDFLKGVCGIGYTKGIQCFSYKELRQVLICVLSLYSCGSSVELFRRVMRVVYPDSLVYSNNDVFRELLIYVGLKECEKELSKIYFLLDVFLPLNYTVHLFWDHHFGIIDVDATLILDDMVLF